MVTATAGSQSPSEVDAREGHVAEPGQADLRQPASGLEPAGGGDAAVDQTSAARELG